jgi:hypothetical protein
LTQAAYNPGDVVTGIVRVSHLDGSAIMSSVNLTYNVSFANSTLPNVNVSLTNTRYDAVFSFVVPRYLSTSVATITYTVRHGNQVLIYQQSVTINNAELLVVDAFSATGYVVAGVPNVVYLQAWQSTQRTDVLDFSNAVVRQSYRLNATVNTSQVVATGVSTVAKGKGSFTFVPLANATALTLEITVNGQVVRRNLVFGNSFNQSSNVAEVTFRILNNNRVLANNEDLQVQFQTNANVNSNDDYVVQIKLKELVVYQEQLSFVPNQVRNLTVLARQFPLINGGVLSVNLFRLTSAFDTFYRSRNGVANTTNSTSSNATGTNTTNTNGTNNTNTTKPTTNTTTNATNTTSNSTNSTSNSTNTTKPANGTNSTTNTTGNTTTNTTGNATTNTTNATTNSSIVPPDWSTTN